MKHNIKITLVILSMFLLTQFIGLFVLNSYATEKVIDGRFTKVMPVKTIPYGMDVSQEQQQDYQINFASIFFSFLVAILTILFLTKIKAKFILRAWFFFVTTLALAIAINTIIPSQLTASEWIALAIAIPFAYSKIYSRNIISHNASELLIYPAIAAIFVPMLNLRTTIFLLIFISIYDMWAVWRSKIMQKMAKFQMEELNIFSGFLIPYKMKKIKAVKKNISKKSTKQDKVNVAILGGGDVIFPIITAGVAMKTWGMLSSVLVIFGALLGLALLLFLSEKKKFYPAMPFITTGIFIGLSISKFFF